jgi:hypothetical protein
MSSWRNPEPENVNVYKYTYITNVKLSHEQGEREGTT